MAKAADQVTEQQILEALRAVRDPDRGGDIVSLGMVSGLIVKDGNVGFTLEVDPQRGAKLEPLRKAAEKAVASYRIPRKTARAATRFSWWAAEFTRMIIAAQSISVLFSHSSS